MPGTICSVALCSNNYGDVKKEGRTVSFHRFPKHPELKKIWVRNCKRADQWNPDGAYICSDHFKEKDFKEDFQAVFTGEKRKRYLRSNAIPSQNLVPDKIIETPNASKNETNIEKKNKRKRISLPENDEVEIRQTTCKRISFEGKDNFEESVAIKREEEDITDNSLMENKVFIEDEEGIPLQKRQYNGTYSKNKVKSSSVNNYSVFQNGVLIDVKLIGKVLHTINKMKDDCSFFGCFVASELRNISSDRLKFKLRKQIQRAILRVAEEDEKIVF